MADLAGQLDLANDHFETPGWCVDAVVEESHLPLSGLILDPGCGDGAIASRLITHHGVQPYRILGVELDKGRAQSFADKTGSDVICGDFLTTALPNEGDYGLIIGNPPFSLALQFIQRCIPLVKKVNGTIALLLRVGFLASRERRDFLTTTRPDLDVLSARPSFAAVITCAGTKKKGERRVGGCGWRVALSVDALRPAVCPTCGQPVTCNTQDASDYGWYVWGPGRNGTLHWLRGEPPRLAQVQDCERANVSSTTAGSLAGEPVEVLT